MASMFYRERNGSYRNYAAASDIARAALMVTEGGVYMDVDIVPRDTFGDLVPPRGFMLPRRENLVINSILASYRDSTLAGELLSGIEIMTDEYDARYADEPIEEPFSDNNWGLPSWWRKRAVPSRDNDDRTTRLTGTVDTSGPGVLMALGANVSASLADFFPENSIGHSNYQYGHPTNLSDARRQLIGLAAPAPDFRVSQLAILLPNWVDQPDASAPWSMVRGARRSSIP